MKLIRLQVTHFGCVRSAKIDFGPGLNILHGPNDLGKSSLAAAIRAALLLQHSSSAHEPYVPWNGMLSPHVELTLQIGPQRYYRIHKSFGSKGTSLLEFSKDGHTFQPEAKGREVDGAIRSDLLRWGIPEPGGRSGAKGFPSSFLTTALLAEQDAVMELFDRKLGDDANESGKVLLTDALQATARDPSFTDMVQRAQEKVSEAFTPTGQRSRARNSPFYRVAEEIKKASSELEDLSKQALAGERIRTQLANINAALLIKEAEYIEASEAEQKLLAVAAKQRELAEAQTTLAEGKDLVARAHEAQEALVRAYELSDAFKKQRDECDEKLQRAKETLEGARGHLQELRSKQAAILRRIHDYELEEVKLAHQLRDARDRAANAKTAGEIAELETAMTKKAAGHSCDKIALGELESERQLLTAVELWLRQQELDEQIEQSQQTVIELAALYTQAEDAEQTAGVLTADILARGLPSAELIERLRELDNELRMAEAAVGVGLSVTIESEIGLRIDASRDQGDVESLAEMPGLQELRATREIRLLLPNLASIHILGGSREAQMRYHRALEAWRDQVAPVLEKADVSSLKQLEELMAEDRRDLQRIVELLDEEGRTKQQFESQREKLVNDHSLRREAVKLKERLAAYNLELVAERAEALGGRSEAPAMLEQAKTVVDAKLASLRTRMDAVALELAKDEARLNSLRERLCDGWTNRDAAVKALAETWPGVLAEAKDLIDSLEGQLAELTGKRASLSDETGDELELAQAAETSAKNMLEEVELERKRISSQLEEARNKQGRLDSDCNTKMEAAERVNLGQAQERVTWLSEELAQLRGSLGWGADHPEITEEDTTDARRASARLRDEVRELEKQLDQTRGALRETGGDRVREETESRREHVERLQQKQHDLELDYDAWKLLLDTLREVDKDQAAHLGKIMIGPITEQFQELTKSRYGAMELGPNLEAHGIEAAGERRDITILSMGTKEQLSTLFRLSLAEKLGSAVLLDDQLTQTDPERMRWFQTKLRKISRQIQIIVLTCRPADYLGGSDDGPDISAVQLDQVISRL